MKAKLIFGLLLSSVAVCAQTGSYEDFRKQREQQFADFKQRKEQEYEEYRARLNAEYAEFMRKSWERFYGMQPLQRPVKEEPVVPPVVIPEEDEARPLEDNLLPYGEVIPQPAPTPAPQPITPIQDNPQPHDRTLSFQFYGTACSVRLPAEPRRLAATDENACADYWEWMCQTCNNLLHDCLNLREALSLCDWGYLKLTETIAQQATSSGNEAVLAQSFLLSQSGFKIHIARDPERSLHLLVATNDGLYGYPRYVFGNETYYLLDGSAADQLCVFTETFPDEQALRMNITQNMELALRVGEKRELRSKRYPDLCVRVAANRNLLDFYDDYPASFMNNDGRTKWAFYAQAPLDKDVCEQIYPKFRQSLAGKSEWEAVSMLLNFVQTAFEYEYDDKVWGYDRAFFAEETLHYPYSDCEDRSILFAHLVRDLLHLDVVLLYYPGHLATAVHFSGNEQGDYLLVGNKKYIVCDPTYIGASPGRTMPDMDNSQAFVILL